MNQESRQRLLMKDDETNEGRVLDEKLIDALTPGLLITFDPNEASRAGAFMEDALSEVDAFESNADLVAL